MVIMDFDDYRQRGKNFTDVEKLELINAVIQRSDVLFGTYSPILTRSKKYNAWNEVLAAVNAVAPEPRNFQQINKKWKYLKKTALEIFAHNVKVARKSAVEADGETAKCLKPINVIYQRIIRNTPKSVITAFVGTADNDAVVENLLNSELAVPEINIAEVQDGMTRNTASASIITLQGVSTEANSATTTESNTAAESSNTAAESSNTAAESSNTAAESSNTAAESSNTAAERRETTSTMAAKTANDPVIQSTTAIINVLNESGPSGQHKAASKDQLTPSPSIKRKRGEYTRTPTNALFQRQITLFEDQLECMKHFEKLVNNHCDVEEKKLKIEEEKLEVLKQMRDMQRVQVELKIKELPCVSN